VLVLVQCAFARTNARAAARAAAGARGDGGPPPAPPGDRRLPASAAVRAQNPFSRSCRGRDVKHVRRTAVRPPPVLLTPHGLRSPLHAGRPLRQRDRRLSARVRPASGKRRKSPLVLASPRPREWHARRLRFFGCTPLSWRGGEEAAPLWRDILHQPPLTSPLRFLQRATPPPPTRSHSAGASTARRFASEKVTLTRCWHRTSRSRRVGAPVGSPSQLRHSALTLYSLRPRREGVVL